jgi:hypothetical protein
MPKLLDEKEELSTPKKQTNKGNKWIDHVKKTAQENNVSYKKALSMAKESYKKETNHINEA